MKLIQLNKDKAVLEISRIELQDLAATVFSADAFFESLDASAYNITEASVEKCADEIRKILDLVSRPAG